MGDGLRIDTSVLIDAGRALRVVAQEFAAANDHSDEAAAAVGHHAQAGAVRAFAHDWDNRRAKMLEEIAELAAATHGVGQGFEDLDWTLGAALRGEPASTQIRRAQ
jgi:hypothetical protein